eukprot:CAMPEP_0116846110 /NCGR_PEP_ID=MMETSP0418-20121206/13652_1 /TAXON_ID=1158023 /ORGANISM="Astrosyne radiata, Strain 13vi08-1A" /LENGTH=294 /DNA_ID=CAMNT_0004477319 /DNA_START=66 /DNA_END=950 /DNA_ORIENTATION=+
MSHRLHTVVDAQESKANIREEVNSNSAEKEKSPLLFRPSPYDIISGRGGKSNHHPGNVFFRKAIDYKKSLWDVTAKPHRHLVAKALIKGLEMQNPPSRFLRLDDITKLYYEMEEDEKVDKVCQALRESRGKQQLSSVGEISHHASGAAGTSGYGQLVGTRRQMMIRRQINPAWTGALRALLLPPLMKCLSTHSSHIIKEAARMKFRADRHKQSPRAGKLESKIARKCSKSHAAFQRKKLQQFYATLRTEWHRQFSARFPVLRKEGKSEKEALEQARQECDREMRYQAIRNGGER